MGMYTEMIFGAELKRDTPNTVIESLKYMLGERNERPKDFPFSEYGIDFLFQGGSCYFAVSDPVNRMWFDDVSDAWRISTRSNIKNYNSEIETFLEWIEEYIESGSGYNDMYAIVIYEEQTVPAIYYLNNPIT